MNDITANTVSYFFITTFLVIFSTFGLADFNLNNDPDSIDTITFDYDRKFKLTEDGRVALHNLQNSKYYCVHRSGFSGSYSNEFNDFAILMNEKSAVSALKELTQNGTKYAQAFGLVGLKIKNPDIIETYKPIINKSSKKISINEGCSWQTMKFTYMLFGEKANYFDRLEKELNQRFQWLKSNHKLFQPIGT